MALEGIPPDQLQMTDTPRLIWIPVREAVKLRWERNPKQHDLGALAESFRKHGFKQIPHYDSNIGIDDGNGRVECLDWMERQGQPIVRGIAQSPDGAWVMPLIVGVDDKSKALAEAYAIDANNLVLSGAEFAPWEIAKLWDEQNYVALLQELAGGDALPVSVDGDALNSLLQESHGWNVAPEDIYSDPDGDGIEIQAGYRLGSIWYAMSRETDVRKHMLDLPARPNVHDGATVKLKYSRTNAEETERIVKTYMRPGDVFFEMCCGWMTFSSTAKYFGFSGKGGDVWDVSLDFCKRQIEAMPGEGRVEVIFADCRDTKEPSDTYDFVHSNPPFFNLEPYGESDKDLASLNDYGRWLDAMSDMGREAERILKPGGLANFVINDFRKDGAIVPMHAEFTSAILKKTGMALHDFVVAEVVSQALRFRKHDYERRRTVKCHEYVITFRKQSGLQNTV